MKILIIEDEKGINRLLCNGLSEEGYEVIAAYDGKEGLEKFFNESPDLVLLDWMLPSIEGIEVCNEIRIKDSNVPILFLTAKDTVAETVKGLRAGANDYIKKPFSFEELLERIRIHFRNREEDIIYSVGNVKINASTRQTFVEEQELRLTTREFDLLLYLIENKGKVCTRNEIIHNVWGIKFQYDTGVIDVFINSLRKKLSADRDKGLIRTIRGVGFIVKG
ncbi:MAG: response regulator transcription factor [Bacteroidaceae bacterium]|nr:response regulator transcription factor [Bacteroidaceae bacterium]